MKSFAGKLDLWLFGMDAVQNDRPANGLHMLDRGDPLRKKRTGLSGGKRGCLLNLHLQELTCVESVLNRLNG